MANERMSFNSRALIFANGRIPDPQAVQGLIQPGDRILAADGGSRHVLQLGLAPAAVIGDLDSLTSEEREHLRLSGTELVEYPRDKDATDLELALAYAIGAGCTAIVVVGALGGRLDQTLGNLALLSAERFAGIDLRLDDGLEEVCLVRSRLTIHGQVGELVSLLPWGGPVAGVSTEGLRWPLNRETLFPEKTRGISNEMILPQATVAIEQGLLLVVHRRMKQENRNDE